MDRRGRWELILAICSVYVYDGAWLYVHKLGLMLVDANGGSITGTEVTRERL
jgi:hypothetical protein